MVKVGNIRIADNRVYWIIPKFDNFKFSLFIDSPNVHINDDDWKFTVYPCTSANEWLSIKLYKLCEFRSQVSDMRVGISDEDGREILCAYPKQDGYNFKVDRLIRRSDFESKKEEILPKGNLHLFFEFWKEEDDLDDLKSGFEVEVTTKIDVSNARIARRLKLASLNKGDVSNKNDLNMKEFTDVECKKKDNHKQSNLWTKSVDQLVQNLRSLFISGHNSDVTLEAGGRQFPVHKPILVARSSVFASMFSHDKKEKICGVIYIPDCTSDAFQTFLLFLYTGCIEKFSSDNVFNLYYCAEKYCVGDLKTECTNFIKNNLSVDIFGEAMVLSLQHNDPDLLQQCVQFFCENYKKIVITVHWQKFITDHPIEANELFIKAIGV